MNTSLLTHEFLVLGLGFLILLADLWLLWPPGSRRTTWLPEVALIIVTTHLVVPLTWYHHLTMLLPAFAILISAWQHFRKPTVPAIVACLAYMLLAIHGLFWHWFVGQTLLLDLATWAQLLLWFLLAGEVQRTRQLAAAVQA